MGNTVASPRCVSRTVREKFTRASLSRAVPSVRGWKSATRCSDTCAVLIQSTEQGERRGVQHGADVTTSTILYSETYGRSVGQVRAPAASEDVSLPSVRDKTIVCTSRATQRPRKSRLVSSEFKTAFLLTANVDLD